MTHKNCSGNWQSCPHALLSSSSYVGCSFNGYCDYQTPKDSRNWTIPYEAPSSFENKNYEYFVKDSVQIKDLHAELNAFSKDGWEIFKLTNYETEMNSYWTIVARKKEMKK